MWARVTGSKDTIVYNEDKAINAYWNKKLMLNKQNKC